MDISQTLLWVTERNIIIVCYTHEWTRSYITFSKKLLVIGCQFIPVVVELGFVPPSLPFLRLYQRHHPFSIHQQYFSCSLSLPHRSSLPQTFHLFTQNPTASRNNHHPSAASSLTLSKRRYSWSEWSAFPVFWFLDGRFLDDWVPFVLQRTLNRVAGTPGRNKGF